MRKRASSIRERNQPHQHIAAVVFLKQPVFISGERGPDYLKKRGIQEDVIKEFRLGFALDGWRHLRDYFEKAGNFLETC